jgi:hypothetical protein
MNKPIEFCRSCGRVDLIAQCNDGSCETTPLQSYTDLGEERYIQFLEYKYGMGSALEFHQNYGWFNGCRYGMGDGPEDYITECDCFEDEV